MRHRRTRIAIATLLAAGAAIGLGAVSGARSSGQAAWQWAVPVPGDPAPAATGPSAVRTLASAGDFALDAANDDGELLVGPAVDGRPDLEPLAQAANGGPLVVYTSAAAEPGTQAVVGVARADVDRVTATLPDGSQVELPLNQWRGFSYTAAAPTQTATQIDAYAGGSAVGAVRLPQTAISAATATADARTPVFEIARASLTAQTLRISRADSRTLQPTGASLLLRGAVAGPIALSPDQTQLALVTTPSTSSANGARLQIVDLQGMRLLHTFPLGASSIRALSWPTAGSLLELRQTMGPPYNRNVRSRVVWAIDPTTGSRTGTGSITNKLAVRQSFATPQGLVLLLAPSELRGRADAQVVFVSADAHVTSLTMPLRAIKGGSLNSRLAVDSGTGHAYVVAPGGAVFDIDGNTMTMTRHQLRPPASRTTPPLIGSQDAEVIAGKIVLAGLLPTRSGGPAQGVVLVNPQNWSTRVVDRAASQFVVLGDRLLTYGITASKTAPYDTVAHGLALYDSTGRRITHLYGSRSFRNVLLTPGFGHVLYNGPSSGTRPKPGVRYSRGIDYYAGPNDQLAFGLKSGAPAGRGAVSTQKPPLGAPILVFRGSQTIGEPGGRQPASASAAPPTPSAPPTTTPTTSTTSAATTPAARTPQATQPRRGYTVSNLGRTVPYHGRALFNDPRVKPQLYLLGSAGGTAFYRVQVTPHYRCWGSGNVSAIGSIGSLSCPTVVGAYPLQLDDEMIEFSPKKPRTPTYLRIDGIVADGATKVELRDDSGKAVATAPVTNNLFSFPRPYPKTFVHAVAVDANGNDLLAHPAWGEHQQQPPFLFGPRATKVSPSRLGPVRQHAQADGVDVSVGTNGIVDVRLTGISAQTRQRISGRNVGVNCFSVSPTIRHTRGAGVSLTWGTTTEVAFKILGYIKPPYDGCEITSTVGHRWHDQWGTHSPVEVPLTPRGEHYFANRAAARDLALFVRSRKMHQFRKLEGVAVIAAIRKQYGHVVAILTSPTASAPSDTVGVWAAGTKTVISERSSAGGRFYVEIDNGHITKENVRGLAFVF